MTSKEQYDELIKELSIIEARIATAWTDFITFYENNFASTSSLFSDLQTPRQLKDVQLAILDKRSVVAKISNLLVNNQDTLEVVEKK